MSVMELLTLNIPGDVMGGWIESEGNIIAILDYCQVSPDVEVEVSSALPVDTEEHASTIA